MVILENIEYTDKQNEKKSKFKLSEIMIANVLLYFLSDFFLVTCELYSKIPFYKFTCDQKKV